MSGKRYIDQANDYYVHRSHRASDEFSSRKRSNNPSQEQHLVHQPGDELKLLTNSYCIARTENDRKIHYYELIVTINEKFKDVPNDVLGRHFVSKSIRKLLIKDILPNLLEHEPRANISVVIDTKAESIFSLEPLKYKGNESTDSIFRFEDVRLATELLKCLHVDICIKYSRSFKNSVFEDQIKFINSVMHHQMAIDLTRFGSAYFNLVDILSGSNHNRLDLISQEIKGISISGIKQTVEGRNLVVISSPHAYLTGSHRLIDLLATFIDNQPVQGLELDHSTRRPNHALKPEIKSIVGDEDWFKAFVNILSGYKCYLNEADKRINLRFEISDLPASKQVINEETQQTVEQFYETMNIYLNYPNLPCLKSRALSQPYFPFELCTLLPGQKVPIFRLSSSAKNRLSLLNKPKPELSRQLSIDAKARIMTTSAGHLKAFGLDISDEPFEASGTILQKPTLSYGNTSLRPRNDYWESGSFQRPRDLLDNWCVVNACSVDRKQEELFFQQFCAYSQKFGMQISEPVIMNYTKDLLIDVGGLDESISRSLNLTNGNLRLIMYVIDSQSSQLNRLIHLKFGNIQDFTATCIRVDSILNYRIRTSIYRTLIHKLNTRLGGINVTYDRLAMSDLELAIDELLVIGLDVTHPDNELTGVSIVGCAYTYDKYLFKHRSIVWPQAARTEIITKMDSLMEHILSQYRDENRGRLPGHILVYRDGVSREEFDKVREVEIAKIETVLDKFAKTHGCYRPKLSFIIAQKRHTMRFYHLKLGHVFNPPSGTLVDKDVVSQETREFYLYSNTSPQATSRPLYYHVLKSGLCIRTLQNLTYHLCFNFGKCSGSLSMPSSLKYAHNAAYDARNYVIESRTFRTDVFYPCKFFC